MLQRLAQTARTVDHHIPIVTRDLAQEIQLAGQKAEPLRRHIVDHRIDYPVKGHLVRPRHQRRRPLAPAAPRRITREDHLVVAPPLGQPVRSAAHRVTAERRTVLLDRLARHDRRETHREVPDKLMRRPRQRDAHRLRVERLQPAHRTRVIRGRAAHRRLRERPHAADRIKHQPLAGRRHAPIPQPFQRKHHVIRRDRPPPRAPVRIQPEAGVRLKTRLRIKPHHIDQSVRLHLRQCRRQTGDQPVRTRAVVVLQQRLVHELRRTRRIDRRRIGRIHARHPLHAAAVYSLTRRQTRTPPSKTHHQCRPHEQSASGRSMRRSCVSGEDGEGKSGTGVARASCPCFMGGTPMPRGFLQEPHQPTPHPITSLRRPPPDVDRSATARAHGSPASPASVVPDPPQ